MNGYQACKKRPASGRSAEKNSKHVAASSKQSEDPQKYKRPAFAPKKDMLAFELFHQWNKILARANEKLARRSPIRRDILTRY